MTWQFNIYGFPILGMLLPLTFFTALVYQRSQGRLARLYFVFSFFAGAMTIATALSHFSGDYHTLLRMTQLNVSFTNMIPIMVFFTFAEISGYGRIFSGWRGFLVTLPVYLGTLSVLTNDLHRHYWSRFEYGKQGSQLVLNKSVGLFEQLSTYYIYLLMLATIVMMVNAWRKQQGPQRRQFYYLGAAILIPVLVDLTDMLRIVHWGPIYPTPYAIFISVILMGISMLRYNFMDIVPIAQGEVFHSMRDAILVMDVEGNLVAANPFGRRLFHIGTEKYGRDPHLFLPPDLHPLLDTDRNDFQEFQIGKSTFDVTNSLVTRYGGRQAGRILTFRNISERKQYEASLKKALAEKETLFQEVHHRVKNNFSLVASLLSLEAAQIQDPELRKAFEDSRSRVYSMSRVHETLYLSRDMTELDLGDYLSKLVREMIQPMKREITLKTEIEPVRIGIDRAVPCGLIVNEIVTNTLKHGISEDHRDPRVTLRVVRQDANLLLEIRDNGKGFTPGDLDKETLGMQLIQMLTEDQLGGHLEFSGEQGGCFTIRFPLEPVLD